MSRTIIFLDFDGVLNGPGDHLDAPCMNVFGRMLEMAPTAEIVVSSTWRLWRSLPELAAMFRPFGLDVTFAGATPVAHSQKPFSVAAYVNGALKVLDGNWGRYAEAPASEGMARFRVAERQRMDDYVARRAGGGMYA